MRQPLRPPNDADVPRDSRKNKMSQHDPPTVPLRVTEEAASPARRGRFRRTGTLLVSTVLTAAIGAVVSLNVDAIKSWISTQNPLDVVVTGGSERPLGFSMVVPDPGRLPSGFAQIESCTELWTAGVGAGGVRSDGQQQRLLLQGRAEDGVTIVDMHARITRTQPAIDGAVLACPAAGLAEPIGLTFDLGTSSLAPARHVDPSSGEEVDQFTSGAAITVADKESVPLAVEVRLPEESAYWHLEADVVMNGERRTIVIDDAGKDYFSPGRRPLNQYREGHGAGVFLTDWGVDEAARRHNLSDGSAILEYGAATFPDTAGVEAYRPAGPGASYEEPATERWIRAGGRKILEFVEDLPARPLRPYPKVGDSCVEDELYREDRDQDFGNVDSVSVASTGIRDHGGQKFRHLTVDYTCIKGDRSRESYRLQVAQDLTTFFAFSSLMSNLTDQDRVLAARLLNDVRITAGS